MIKYEDITLEQIDVYENETIICDGDSKRIIMED